MNLSEKLIKNRYKIGNRIAQGGFGVVFEGKDLQTKEGLAIKIVRFNFQFSKFLSSFLLH